MGLIGLCLRFPAAVAVGVALVMLLGVMSVTRLPLQLFPNIERPQLNVQISWRAASPEEVEAELLEPLEDVMRGIPGMVEMQGWANAGNANLNMTFAIDTDMRATSMQVLSRIQRLPTLPTDADPPVLNFGSGFGGDSNETLIYYFVQLLPGNSREIADFLPFLEEQVVARLEEIPGVAGASFGSGSPAENELQIIFDPFKAAQYGVDIPSMAALVGRSDDVSGGFVDVGRRQYTLKYEGRFDPSDFESLILEWREGRPVRLGDVAEVTIQPGERNSFAFQNGNPAISIQLFKESGANVLSTLTEVESVVDELRGTVMKEQGLDIRKSFDPSVFIMRAISLLASNLVVGVLLAVGVLWLFLRQIRATLLIAVAIPICLLTTFLVLEITGRSLNVISLAGLAFATGMVLDAAIVVLESIVRRREAGMDAETASGQGAVSVWAALLASTATTVAIFIPIIFLKDVEGQLFADLALTIAIGVSVSLLVAILVLPPAAKLFLRTAPRTEDKATRMTAIAETIMRLTQTPLRRWSWLAVLMGGSVALTVFLFPGWGYLPPVKRDAVDTWLGLPAGVNNEILRDEIAPVLLERIQPFMEGTREPALRNYYLLGWPGGGTIGARVKDQSPENVAELTRIFNEEILVGIPDLRAQARQGNLFGGFGNSNGENVNIHLQSAESGDLGAVIQEAEAIVRSVLPQGAALWTWPNPDQSQPELRLVPNDERILEAQMTRQQVAGVVRALGNGMWLGEYFDGEKSLDIILKSSGWTNPDELGGIPVATPSGAVLPLRELVAIERTVGPSNIRRLEGRRTFTMSVPVPEGMTIEGLLSLLRAEAAPRLREILPPDGSIRYAGSADSVQETRVTMGQNLALAFLILAMLMAALFRSLRDSLFVLITIPLAGVGGMAALNLLGLWQGFTGAGGQTPQVDLLTMFGFIILMGLVVNNAILLVDQTRQGERAGLPRRDAVDQALKLRTRPILMSTLTSIFGMLPLVLIPGEGSVIYRGLAVTIVGGMSVSMIFTLIMLPCLLRMGETRDASSVPAGPGAAPLPAHSPAE